MTYDYAKISRTISAYKRVRIDIISSYNEKMLQKAESRMNNFMREGLIGSRDANKLSNLIIEQRMKLAV